MEVTTSDIFAAIRPENDEFKDGFELDASTAFVRHKECQILPWLVYNEPSTFRKSVEYPILHPTSPIIPHKGW